MNQPAAHSVCNIDHGWKRVCIGLNPKDGTAINKMQGRDRSHSFSTSSLDGMLHP